MQLKNEKLKKEIQETQKSDTQKQKEAATNAKTILEEIFKKPTKDEKRSGKLWGFGVAGMNVDYKKAISTCIYLNGCSTSYQDTQETGVDIEFQIGGITMWNRYFGIQYYSNTDVAFDTNFNYYSVIQTINTDAILNPYNSDDFGFGFLLGIGVGARADINPHYFVGYGFDARANIGARMIFGDNCALDFMVRIPFTSTQETSGFKENMTFGARLSIGIF